ncbi:flavodoxin family protein [Patescibacteria group bacterium]
MNKILLISGSSRKGNTDFILNKLSNELSGEKEIIYLRDKKIEYCKGCLRDHQVAECFIKDDMEKILKKMGDRNN